jgi:hypothetical protein
MAIFLSACAFAVAVVALLVSMIVASVSTRRRRTPTTPPPLALPEPPTTPPILLTFEAGAEVRGPYNLPSFGQPTLETYDSADYEIPLVCPGCHRSLTDGERFYFIPLLDQPPGSALGVCALCYGKAVS